MDIEVVVVYVGALC